MGLKSDLLTLQLAVKLQGRIPYTYKVHRYVTVDYTSIIPLPRCILHAVSLTSVHCVYLSGIFWDCAHFLNLVGEEFFIRIGLQIVDDTAVVPFSHCVLMVSLLSRKFLSSTCSAFCGTVGPFCLWNLLLGWSSRL